MMSLITDYIFYTIYFLMTLDADMEQLSRKLKGVRMAVPMNRNRTAIHVRAFGAAAI